MCPYARPGCRIEAILCTLNLEIRQRRQDIEHGKRCKPDDDLKGGDEPDFVDAAREVIEQGGNLRGYDLAKTVGVSHHHFHRTFKKKVGVTPRQYRVQHQKLLNMVDSDFGATTFKQIHYYIADSSIGKIVIAESKSGICEVELNNNEADAEKQIRLDYPGASRIDSPSPAMKQVIEAVINPTGKVLDFPIDQQATSFQVKVYDALLRIPRGQTMSYSDIAMLIGSPGAHRAVGTACGNNHLAIVVPCHRAVRANGKPSGYKWGLEFKNRLLDIEQKDQALRVFQ